MSIDCLLYEIKVLKKVSEQLLYWQRIELTAEEAVTPGLVRPLPVIVFVRHQQRNTEEDKTYRNGYQ